METSLGNFPEAVRRFCPIVMYVAGMLFASIVIEVGKRRRVRPLFSIPLMMEATLIALYILLGSRSARTPGTGFYYLLVSMLAIGMGFQNITMRRLGALHVSTTYVTGSLTRLADSVASFVMWMYDRKPPRLVEAWKHESFRNARIIFGVWMFYVIGAGCGAFGTRVWSLYCLLAPLTLICILIAIDQFWPLTRLIERYESPYAEPLD